MYMYMYMYMYNILLHSLHNITAIWEHPKTEYELVLKLEGHSSTVKNVQDSEEKCNRQVHNELSNFTCIKLIVYIHMYMYTVCASHDIQCTMYMTCIISMFHNYDHADTCTLHALQNPTNMPRPLHCMLAKREVLMTGFMIIPCNDHYRLMNTTWAHGHCTFSRY